ncbi:hypothetical protein GE09DRAFT_1197325 [Coniochaeta sp. 2T2.1]|nr:hypothetical protein GE09DRAFT_1197325 [Coniochaeta sp. 2T2.1]
MPPVERDAPGVLDRALKHQHSASSDHGRALVPMWDSSDPERAPPPLPLNPQSPSVNTSRAGTSAAIQSAHQALTEKAREQALVPSLAKRIADVSPDRSMAHKNSAHRRMQSLQPGTVRDLSYMIESGRDSNSSTPRSPEKMDKPSTPNRNNSRDPFTDDRDEKALVATPRPGPSLTPIVRPTARRQHQSILGENTPPQSATMLALQNMSTPTHREPSKLQHQPQPQLPTQAPSESALANITNTSMALVRAPESLNALSSQILSLTNIATSLQKEMSQLSRRSRDNATDLLSLKEATNSRDEDIRKTLRDLVHNMAEAKAKGGNHDIYGNPLMIESKAHSHGFTSPTMSKMSKVSLPRIPSPNSFAASLDRDSVSTPSLYGPDCPATVALLEKIVREMSTKEGQELLLDRLSELSELLSGMATAGKVDELRRAVEASRQDKSVVAAAGGGRGGNGGITRNYGLSSNDDDDDDDENYRSRELDFNYQTTGPMTQRVERLLHNEPRRSSAPAASVVNDEVIKVIKTVKDSVAQGGGLTAEVKALVRELRGEVLGMGREIGRRLDEIAAKSAHRSESATKEEMTKVVEEGLNEMKQHINHMIKEHRRQSAATAQAAAKINAVDYQEIYNAMRAALKDSQAQKPPTQELSREDVIEAVKEAWENYKPEIEIQQIGLERDEILACLQEGLQANPRQEWATREEVFEAVVEGLRHFNPPRVETQASLSRDEILEAVRECLEEFEFPVAEAAPREGVSKEDVLDAVKEDIISRLEDIMEFMRDEFKAVSDEAKQNVAANGRDTEQVLDATKDGFERLRTDMETYVDRACGEAGQEEFLTNLVRTLDGFRDEVTELVAKSSDGSREVIKSEIESLRDAVNSSLVPMSHAAVGSGNHKEVLEALQDGLSCLRSEINSRPIAGVNEILDALQEGLGDLRGSIDKLQNKPVDLTANDEILDALKAGLDSVRSEIDVLREESKNDKALTTFDSAPGAIIPADMAKHEDIKNLEVLITQLRIKVEAMETPPMAAPSVGGAAKEDLAEMEETLRTLQDAVASVADTVAGIPEGRASTDPSTREDVQAIETILRNTKARLDDLIDGEQAVRKEHIDVLETLILETRESLSGLSSHLDNVSRKEDITIVESLVTQVVGAFDEMKERHEKALEDPEKVTKTDVDAIEAVCLDVKTLVEQVVKADLAALPSKEDISNLETLLKEYKEKIDANSESQSKDLELRQLETVGVSERVTEVKIFLEDFQGVVKEKLDQGATGIDAMNKILDSLGETINKNATISDDLKDMFLIMKDEFEESKAGVVGAKLDADEKFQQTTDTIVTKLDERVDELMAKYDDFQLVMEDRATKGEARDAEMESAMLGSKAIAEELKSLIDTLGSAVTDSMEKMEEASKTVFIRVEDLVTKTDENHSDDKAEHQLTRDHVKEAVTIVEGLQGHVVEYQPKILESIKDVLLLVGQHYEHTKTATSDLAQSLTSKIEESKPEPLLLQDIPKYDDTGLHEKLDKLVDHSTEQEKTLAQLETLDIVHKQVVQTAAEISAFLAAQTQRIEDDHEDREKTLQEANIALERRLAEKEQLEASEKRYTSTLREEEERLKKGLQALRSEQESLNKQKMRLSADLSSLETALRLRKEELHEMEARAEGLERRILEGVMDHSRVLLMAKANRPVSTHAVGKDPMSRKRVPSHKPAPQPTTAPITTAADKPKETIKPKTAFNMAMNSTANRTLAAPNQARRILSLSQITGNATSGGFKRSQSVRQPGGAGAYRKSSWGGGKGPASKRPISLVPESEEEHHDLAVITPPTDSELTRVGSEGGYDYADEDGSEPETLRRSSRGTTVYTGTGTEMSYDGTEEEYSDDEGYVRSEWTESGLGTESYLGTESMVSEGSAQGGEVVVYQS